jgi:hypothetical protein
MTIDDLRGFMKEKGLITRARNRDIVLQRHYIAAYMFWILKMSLSAIGKELNRNHDAIRHNIIEVFFIQNHPEFIEFTEELRSKIPMKFPQYLEKSPRETTETSYTIEININQKEFEQFIDSNYSKDEIMRIFFKQFINYATTSKNKSNRSSKRIQFPNERPDNRE